jgi:hypothetical protein
LPVVLTLAGVAAFAALMIGLAFRGSKRRCRNCGASIPPARLPKSLGQALTGGWTCPTCGADNG